MMWIHFAAAIGMAVCGLITLSHALDMFDASKPLHRSSGLWSAGYFVSLLLLMVT